MSKILLNTIDIKNVDHCYESLGIKDDYVVDSNLHDDTSEIKKIFNFWDKEIKNNIDCWHRTLIQLYSKDFNHNTIDVLQHLTDLSDKLSEDSKKLYHATANIVAQYKCKTTPAQLTMLCNDDHIKDLIDKHFDDENICLEIIYENGEFWLSSLLDKESESVKIEAVATGDLEALDDFVNHISNVSPKAEKLCKEIHFAHIE